MAAHQSIGTVSSTCTTQGFRDHMEDTYNQVENVFGTGIYAIFDGHSGNCSSIVAANRLEEMIETELWPALNPNDCRTCSFMERQNGKLNIEEILRYFIDRVEQRLKAATTKISQKSGTTCLIAIAEKHRLTVANVGDSRGVMCNSKGVAINLSFDHKPDRTDEKQRIEKAGDEIIESSPGIWRVRGLAMSRSLGDICRKRNDNVIIATPDILTFNLDQRRPLFMILASDGLWDVMTNQDAVNFIIERYTQSPDFGASELVKKALKLKSKDNITVIIVVFKNGCYQVGSVNS